MNAYVLLIFSFFFSNSLGSQPWEWCHQQWLSFPISVNLYTYSARDAQRPIDQVILEIVKLMVVIDHLSGRTGSFRDLQNMLRAFLIHQLASNGKPTFLPPFF